MLSTNRKYLIAGIVAILSILFGLTFLIKDEPPPRPAPPIEEVRMPPPPPLPTPEQIAAAQALAQAAAVAAAEEARIAQEAAKKAELASQKAIADKKSATKPPVQKKAPVAAAKPTPTQTEPAVTTAVSEPAKPKSARFNMTQDGKKMTAEDFDAWMKSQGIRIVPAKTAEPAPTPPAEQKKDEGSR
jgi:hypothetical protein